MKLLRIGINNYRSIGEDYVFLDLRKKINLLIGANNCGKSNVLRVVQMLGKHSFPFQALPETDRHQRKSDSNIGFCFELETAGSKFPELQKLGKVSIEWISTGSDWTDMAVVHTNLDSELNVRAKCSLITSVIRLDFHHANPTEKEIAEEINNVAKQFLHNPRKEFPHAVIVPQFRQIVEGETYSLEGSGVVKLLSSWQHPEIGKDKDHERFRKIEDLLRRLLEMPNANLEVSHKQDHILVSNNGLRLRLEHYGTGIHELIIIAIAVLSEENAIFCIEEPEIHLHPLLQKRLVDFLRKETKNQYVITTHSPSLITPQDDTAIIHLWLENGITKSRQVETTAHSLQVLHDLGAQASDLLQANSAIWVEGPSDRIYVNAWLRLIDPTLREGIDYSIMFYGGRLLSHLSLEREQSDEADDLVKLLRINQHSAILIDSDKNAAADAINKTKQRIKDECEKSGVLCWITAGREIENYLPASAVAKAYAEIAGKEPALKLNKFGRLEKSLEKAFDTDWKPSWSYDIAKPERARAISQHLDAASLDSELRKELEQLVAVIKHRR